MICSAALEPMFPALMKPLIDSSLIAKDPQSLTLVPILIVLVFLGKAVVDYLGSLSSQYIAQRTISDLRQVLFEKQLLLPMRSHQNEEGGRMLSRITSETALIGEAVSSAWLTIVRDSLVIIGLMGFLFYTAWQLTLIVIAVAPLVGLVIRWTNSKIRAASVRSQGFMGRIAGFVEESLAGLSEIKMFGAFGQHGEKFKALNTGLRRENLRAAAAQSLNVPLVQVVAAVAVAVVIYTASQLTQSDQLSPGEFVAFITAMSMVFEPVRRLANVSGALQRGLAAAESIFEILDRSDEEKTSSGFDSTSTPSMKPQELWGPTGQFVFSGVSFRYPGQSRDAIHSLDLTIRHGDRLLLRGPSGAGKSTVLYLLAGLDHPSIGHITLSGLDLRTLDTNAIRRLVAFVGQKANLFNMTIRQNMQLSKHDASDEEIKAALLAANALEFVEALPARLDTPLGTHGGRLSGGQRQRLSVARAYLKDAPILLLDEPTSALDPESEGLVMEALEQLMIGKTVVMVSHKPVPENLGFRVIQIDALAGHSHLSE